MRAVVNAFIGLDVRQVGDPWGLKTLKLPGGIIVEQRHIAMFVTTGILIAGLFAFFRYTRMGLAMRAASFDQEAALAQGVSVGAVFALSWALAGALAAVAGAFAGVGSSVSESLWLIALTALPVIILGGLDSLPGAVVGGLIVGIVARGEANAGGPVGTRRGREAVRGDARCAARPPVRAVRHQRSGARVKAELREMLS